MTELLKSRKQRREEARQSKVEFVPQYNFTHESQLQDNGLPMRSQSKKVLKMKMNDLEYKEKMDKRGKQSE
jgi:hypothetical protein